MGKHQQLLSLKILWWAQKKLFWGEEYSSSDLFLFLPSFFNFFLNL
jgi:hypothetical protein